MVELALCLCALGDCGDCGDCDCGDCCCGRRGSCGDCDCDFGPSCNCDGDVNNLCCLRCEGGSCDACDCVESTARSVDNVCAAGNSCSDLCTCQACTPEMCFAAASLEGLDGISGGHRTQQHMPFCCWHMTPYTYGCYCDCECGDCEDENKGEKLQADIHGDKEPKGNRSGSVLAAHPMRDAESAGVVWLDKRMRKHTLELDYGSHGQRPIPVYSGEDCTDIPGPKPVGIPVERIEYTPGLRRCCGVAEGPAFLLIPIPGAGTVVRASADGEDGELITVVAAQVRSVADAAGVQHNIKDEISWEEGSDWWSTATCCCLPCACMGKVCELVMSLFYFLCFPLSPSSDCALRCERCVEQTPCVCCLCCPDYDKTTWSRPPAPWFDQKADPAAVAVVAERFRRAGDVERSKLLVQAATKEARRRRTSRTWRRFCVIGVMLGLFHVLVAGGLLVSLQLLPPPLGRCAVDTYHCEEVEGTLTHRAGGATKRARNVWRAVFSTYSQHRMQWLPEPGAEGSPQDCPEDKVYGETFTDGDNPAGNRSRAYRDCERAASQVYSNGTLVGGSNSTRYVKCMLGNWWAQFTKKKVCQTEAGREYFLALYSVFVAFGGLLVLIFFPVTWWVSRGLAWRRRVRHQMQVDKCGPPLTGPMAQVMQDSMAPEALPVAKVLEVDKPPPVPGLPPDGSYFNMDASVGSTTRMNRQSFSDNARAWAASAGVSQAAQPTSRPNPLSGVTTPTGSHGSLSPSHNRVSLGPGGRPAIQPFAPPRRAPSGVTTPTGTTQPLSIL
eukprot:TRINITY_DN15383_c0_g1_i1.p1 TRINITY_DN15383_c0_g1~~TRINITY_DN15383_c0_g1_i1.p1  ORF type:complete len:803 (+),score=107.34 TRINITY_DN15383_c0_g1_i1:65-2410(+)